mmetsp:Transcript_12164/g.42704  ORF Transcript_12164/g.42704 Transcript_12164/m.42704 type:complete len:212 (+) Transcript_12164:656-1291(+)
MRMRASRSCGDRSARPPPCTTAPSSASACPSSRTQRRQSLRASPGTAHRSAASGRSLRTGLAASLLAASRTCAPRQTQRRPRCAAARGMGMAPAVEGATSGAATSTSRTRRRALWARIGEVLSAGGTASTGSAAQRKARTGASSWQRPRRRARGTHGRSWRVPTSPFRRRTWGLAVATSAAPAKTAATTATLAAGRGSAAATTRIGARHRP